MQPPDRDWTEIRHHDRARGAVSQRTAVTKLHCCDITGKEISKMKDDYGDSLYAARKPKLLLVDSL